MQVLQHPPGHIPSQLQLEVLLANNNIPEAFHHARLYEDETGRPLLEHFFRHCISARKFNVLGSLCLREEEEQLVYRLLRQCKTRKADCVQLILLLKRCKYIEAVSFMDEVAAERSQAGMDSDDPSTILSAYRHTMAPVNQSIAGKYFRIRNNLNGAQLRNMAPEPFSCQLAKQSASGTLGGIFQSSALSAHWATRYAHEPRMLQGPNMPFLRNAAVQGAGAILPSSQRRIVRPTPYQHAEKRALERERELEEGREVSLSKRRRLLPGGEQFTQDVGNFVQRMQQLKQADRERQQELERQQEQQRDQEQVLALMKPPEYLQRGERERTGVGAGAGVGVVPPAILRRRASAAEAVQRRSRYSFMAPIPLGGCRQEEVQEEEQLQEQVEQEQMELDEGHQIQAEEQKRKQQESDQEQDSQQEEEEDTDEIIVEIQHGNSSQTEEDSNSDEEYMSPLASANTSLVQMAPPTGPQPRNSLQQQGSSGFGSFASSIQSGSTRGSLFVPPVCSSKMHVQEVQQQQSSTVVRISERTTICGDLNESSLAATATSSLWAMPSVSLGTPRQPLQRLDTTLGMSSYDVTEAGAGAAAAVAQVPTEYIELDEDEVQEREQHRELRRRRRSSCSGSDEDVEVPMVGMDYQPSSYSVSSELSGSGSPAAHDEPVYSIVVESTTSINTSRSPTSHTPTSFMPSDTNVSLNSSPRATGTDGGGGPGGATGNAADGSNRSIYRANSLETVDDLDTTKGSLEEDDDIDMLDEDECVIALDGTEVRGYVARPEPIAGACSSAELFSFKKDEAEEGTAEHMPCPSQGATLGANSDSAMGYTINLDSIESAGNESVATVHKHQEAVEQEQQQEGEGEQHIEQVSGEHNAARPVEDVIDTIEESPTDQVILVESDCELVDTTAHESDVEIVEQSVFSDADSQNILVLTVSDNEEEEVVEVTEEGNKAQQEEQQRQEEIKQQEEKRLGEEQRKLELEKLLQEEKRLQEEKQLQEEKRLQEEKQRLEEEKQRLEEEKQRLEEDEKQRQEEKQRLEEEEKQRLEEEKRLEEKQRLEKQRLEEEEKQRLEEEKLRLKEKQEEAKELQENEQQMEIDVEQEDKEEEKLQQSLQKQRKQKKPVEVEEEPAASSKHPVVRILRTRHNATPTSSPVPERSASAIGFESPASSPAPSPSTSPVFQMRRRLRSSDRQQSASPATLERGTPSPATVSTAATRRAQRQRRLRSDDSVASVDSQAELAKRVLRAGSMPAMSSVPVSTPKRRTRLLPKPLEVIQETGEASLMPRTRSRTQLNQSIVDVDVDTPKRKLRSTSEPPREAAVTAPTVAAPKPTRPKRTRKSSVASSVASTDGPPTEDSPQPRVLRSRRSTVEEPQASPVPSPTPEVSHGKRILLYPSVVFFVFTLLFLQPMKPMCLPRNAAGQGNRERWSCLLPWLYI